jgi:hypothetical protein
MVAQTYNQSYSGGSDCEGSSSRSAWAKSSWDPSQPMPLCGGVYLSSQLCAEAQKKK